MTEESHFEEQPPVIVNRTAFDGQRKPTGKWVILGVGVLLLGVVAAVVTIKSNSDTTSAGDAKSTAITPSKKDMEVGGKGTAAYNDAVNDQSNRLAIAAASQGRSYVAPPVNSNLVSTARPEPIVEKQTAQQIQQTQQEITNIKASMKASLDGITAGMQMSPQSQVSFKELNPAQNEVALSGAGGQNSGGIQNAALLLKDNATVTAKSIRLPGGIHAGSILYAVNDLKLNSDGKNTVVRASIISGSLNHYTALGQFEGGGESLSIKFSRLISPDGEEYPVSAYGIDPSIPEANVASNVDNHMLSRWGGMIAASFLTGFADATRMSGMSTSNIASTQIGANGLPITPSYGLMNIPIYSLEQKGLIALGNVGQQAGVQLAAGLKRPPTVTLDAGITMGILIISADSSGGGGAKQ